jgi:hypothetical protein
MFKKFILFLVLGVCCSLSLTAHLSSGPNHKQKAPKLTSAEIKDTKTRVKGTLESVKETYFVIQFFNNLQKEGDITEGNILLGQIKVKTDHSGKASFTAYLPQTAYGSYISATATRQRDGANKDSSEFSKNVKVH